MALTLHRTAFICANPRCHKRVSKIRLWLSTQPPFVLNGGSYCSENCLRPQLQTILSTAVFHKHLSALPIHRSTIGLILLDYNLINLAQLNEVLLRQRNGDNRYLGEIIISLGYATEQQVTLALSKQEALPWVDVEEQIVEKGALSKVPPAVAFFSLIHPLDFDPILNELNIVAAAPLDRKAIGALQQANHCKISCFISPESKVKKLIRRNYGELVADALLQPKTILRPDDLYVFREELIQDYKTKSATAMDVSACRNYIWIRFSSPQGLSDFFYTCKMPEDSIG